MGVIGYEQDRSFLPTLVGYYQRNLDEKTDQRCHATVNVSGSLRMKDHNFLPSISDRRNQKESGLLYNLKSRF